MVNLHTDGYPIIIYEWLLFATATPFIAARLFVQLRFRNRPWRELFVITAWILYLAVTAIDSLENHLGYYNENVDWADPSYSVPGFQGLWVRGMIYKLVLYACKAALLCFYEDVSPRRFFPKTWWVIAAGWFLCACGSLLQVFKGFLNCLPISLNWDINSTACEESLAVWTIPTWAIHLGTDMIVYLVPFVILRNLRTPLGLSERRGAIWMFTLGALNLVSATALLVYNAVPKFYYLRFFYAMCFFEPFQLWSAIIIICLPYCRRLWKGTKAEDLRPGLNAALEQAAYPHEGRDEATQFDLEALPTRDKFRERKGAEHSSDEEC